MIMLHNPVDFYNVDSLKNQNLKIAQFRGSGLMSLTTNKYYLVELVEDSSWLKLITRDHFDKKTTEYIRVRNDDRFRLYDIVNYVVLIDEIEIYPGIVQNGVPYQINIQTGTTTTISFISKQLSILPKDLNNIDNIQDNKTIDYIKTSKVKYNLSLLDNLSLDMFEDCDTKVIQSISSSRCYLAKVGKTVVNYYNHPRYKQILLKDFVKKYKSYDINAWLFGTTDLSISCRYVDDNNHLHTYNLTIQDNNDILSFYTTDGNTYNPGPSFIEYLKFHIANKLFTTVTLDHIYNRLYTPQSQLPPVIRVYAQTIKNDTYYIDRLMKLDQLIVIKKEIRDNKKYSDIVSKL